MSVFVSWSGGKDSSAVCQRALADGMDVACLLNVVTHDGSKTCFHHIDAELIRAQAQAAGIAILQVPTTPETYEEEYVRALEQLRERGITGGVFGDLDYDHHRAWVQRVCRRAGMEAHLPLWKQSQRLVLESFIAGGFEAVLVTARVDVLDQSWLGRPIDDDFLQAYGRLAAEKGLTLCGEAGEYDTLVLDAPFFAQRLEITETRILTRQGYWVLDILSHRLCPKAPSGTESR